MTKRELKNKYLLVIIGACILNVILLLFWFYIKIDPILLKIDDLENKVTNIELKNNYASLEDLKRDLNNISLEYSLIFNVEDKSGLMVKESKLPSNISLFYKMVTVADEPYLVKVFSSQNISIGAIFMQLLVFEIVVVIAILGLIFLFARQTTFKPIEKIINDIKCYKLGKKPIKSINKNEFGVIKNEFVKLTNELEEEKKEQTRIIANISHDIKTPLTSIIGYSDLLINNQLNNEEKIKYGLKINEKALHIKELLDTFDDYLLNHEKITLKKDSIKIKDLVKELYNDYKVELESKKIEFIINTKIDNEYINIDILKLKRVLANIIINSIRYIGDKGKITIDILDNKKDILFLVKDNGPGVDEKIINRIFDPLFTTDSSRKISGLGLSICKEFVEMHGGQIKAYNDEGLVIEFTIPKLEVKEK